MSKQFKHLGVSFEAMLAPDGTPFLNRVTYTQQTGVKIAGNGTIPHPLCVKAEPGFVVWVIQKEHADTITETLEMDTRAGNFDQALRDEIKEAFDSIKEL